MLTWTAADSLARADPVIRPDPSHMGMGATRQASRKAGPKQATSAAVHTLTLAEQERMALQLLGHPFS